MAFIWPVTFMLLLYTHQTKLFINLLQSFSKKYFWGVLLYVSKLLVEVVEYAAVSDESDDGVIGGSDDNQLVT